MSEPIAVVTNDLTPVRQADEQTTEIFNSVKHDILHKVWELHKADEVHHLNQAREIDHLKFFHLVQYRVNEVPYGANYFGKIAVDDKGHCIHVRVFKGADGVKFHSIQTRPTEDGGAVFDQTSDITYFEY
ncbi:hypothetical protein EXIGLDRAFT_702679 [Exidia glandulosa HHB12029]|uniref:Cystatin domain-containing protein n=1 Tax=Exidia glandulosa HHB12029 TaxID=1314781 RepID=A0A165LE22_EXIGL|nr:hypothetical protein EXIGLDRAFT_702679 [Exidia glandulosa HHB12029]